jgi:hypothetical protein
MWAALVAVGTALGALAWPSAAWAVADPPDVRGLAVDTAQKALVGWDEGVIVTLNPGLDTIPPAVDPSNLVVVASQWLNPTPIDPEPPRIVLDLGVAVPDLTGRTVDEARQALAVRGLTWQETPAPTDATWVVRNQRPGGGILARLGSNVFLFLEQPQQPTPEPERSAAPLQPTAAPAAPDRGVPAAAVVVAGGGLALLVVIVLAALALRGRRPKPARTGTPAGGGAPGLQPSESHPAPGVTVRLEPRYDPGTLAVEELRL